jgi:hypothetical protein
MKKIKPSLKLTKTTVRVLQAAELAAVGGGRANPSENPNACVHGLRNPSENPNACVRVLVNPSENPNACV